MGRTAVGIFCAACGVIAGMALGLTIADDGNADTHRAGTGDTASISGTVVSSEAGQTCVRAFDNGELRRAALDNPVCAEGATAPVGAVVAGDMVFVELDSGSGPVTLWRSFRVSQ